MLRRHNNTAAHDPAGGCYTQMDPINLAGGLKTYSYVVDPLGELEPSGLQRFVLLEIEVGQKVSEKKILLPISKDYSHPR
ncbi:uncharacterized protein RhaS with RHS repeats [Kosakonia sp. 1610]